MFLTLGLPAVFLWAAFVQAVRYYHRYAPLSAGFHSGSRYHPAAFNRWKHFSSVSGL